MIPHSPTDHVVLLPTSVAMTQFVNGSFRIVVALIVMTIVTDISMSVRVFKELKMTQTLPNGLFSVKMRPALNILTSHPSKTDHWQCSYFYTKLDVHAFEEPLKTNYCVLWSPRLSR